MNKQDEKKYGSLRDYYLTYLQCYYGAFITTFIGILAIPFLPLPSLTLKLMTVCTLWFMGGYFLLQILYTLGQIRAVFGNIIIDDVISEKVKELGFPFNIMEKLFGYTRKSLYKSANIKYFVIGVGYIYLLFILILSCF